LFLTGSIPVKNKVSVEECSVSDAHRLTIGIKSPSVAFRLNDFSGIVLFFFVSFPKDVPFMHTIAGSLDRH